MQTEIRYKGLTNRPSDQDAEDGTLQSCVNLYAENGEVRPFKMPTSVFYTDGAKVMCVHHGSGFDNYIMYSGSVITFSNKDKTISGSVAVIASVTKISPIGNTLVILSDSGVHYALYRPSKYSYTYLGQKPPELYMNFGLKGYFFVGNSKNGYTSIDETDGTADDTNEEHKGTKIFEDVVNKKYIPHYMNYSLNLETSYSLGNVESNVTELTQGVLSLANKFVNERATKRNRFIFPFFVRYAYRMYDGSLIMHSAPVLMTPSSDLAPVVYCTQHIQDNTDGNNYDLTLYANACGLVCTLDYALTYCADMTALKDKWKDVIKSVDIYVSAPIYTYDQSGKVYGWRYNEYDEMQSHYSIAKILSNNKNISGTGYIKTRFQYQYSNFFGYNDNQNQSGLSVNYPPIIFTLPKVDSSKLKESIDNNSLFYRISTIAVEDLPSASDTRYDVKIKDGVLSELQVQEQMKDDYMTHNMISAACSFPYNSRLNLANVSVKAWGGNPISTMIQHTDAGDKTYQYFIYMRKNGNDICTAGATDAISFISDIDPLYLFFPDTDVYKIRVVRSGMYEDYNLIEHTLLNGMYSFSGFDNPSFSNSYASAPALTSDANLWVNYRNKLYTSHVNNPFVFPATGINTIGDGEIRAISSATKALSEGQFGQFPLYAFTTEGIWALEVSSTGGYSSIQPATRDVIKSGYDPLQMDGAIAFVTDQGLMVLEGSRTACISITIDSEWDRLQDMLNETVVQTAIDTKGTLYIPTQNNVGFKTFLNSSKMAYDYVDGQIWIVNPTYPWAYIYDLESKTWSTFSRIAFTDAVNDYPDALLMNSVGSLFNPAKDDTTATELNRGYLITRPLKLDAPDVLKGITSVMHRGLFDSGDVRSILYGSTDLKHFYAIASSSDHFIRSFHGSAYKYFMFVIMADLNRGEYLSRTTVLYDTRHNDKLR